MFVSGAESLHRKERCFKPPSESALRRTLQASDADALHTQQETARYIVEKKKGHYLFTVKTLEIVYGITSLTPQEATPEKLLNLNRGHWSIENRSHYAILR